MAKGRRTEDGVPEIALKEAVQKARLNPDAFIYDATKTAKAYLEAVFSQDVARLPQNKITEKFFYETRDLIRANRARCFMTCSMLRVDGSVFSGYDANRYSVTSMSFDVEYTAFGEYSGAGGMRPFTDHRKGTFTFINDARLGFVLDGYRDHAS